MPSTQISQSSNEVSNSFTSIPSAILTSFFNPELLRCPKRRCHGYVVSLILQTFAVSITLSTHSSYSLSLRRVIAATLFPFLMIPYRLQRLTEKPFISSLRTERRLHSSPATDKIPVITMSLFSRLLARALLSPRLYLPLTRDPTLQRVYLSAWLISAR